jgi:predicted nucleotidyltransferase
MGVKDECWTADLALGLKVNTAVQKRLLFPQPNSCFDEGVSMKNRIGSKKNIAALFVNKVTSLFPDNIVKIFFFGSRAKGVPKPGSDYDFLIVLRNKDRGTSEGIYEVVTDFLLEYGVDISLKIYSWDDFQKMISIPTPFMASILKTGRELWNLKTER